MNKIYKYYPGNEYSFSSLEEKYFWFSKPPYLNDPFDCSMENLISCDSSLTDEGRRLIKENTEKFGICCFSKNVINLHLWALYANSHKGFCLVFDKDKIQSFCSEKYQADCDLSEIDYRDRPINLNEPILMSEIESEQKFLPIKGILTDPKATDKLFKKLLLQKNTNIWRNEQEMRIVISGRAILNGAKKDDCGSGYKVPFPEGALLEVIIGNKASKTDEDKIDLINSSIYDGALLIKRASLNHENWSLSV